MVIAFALIFVVVTGVGLELMRTDAVLGHSGGNSRRAGPDLERAAVAALSGRSIYDLVLRRW
jgi:hypothetical protein